MLEFDSLIGLFLIGLLLFCLFDAITTPAEAVRNLPKAMWIILIIILGTFGVGSILWLVAGRPAASGRPGGMPYKGNSGAGPAPVRRPGGGRSLAPDDDPDFLRQLKKSNDDHESMLNQWEADLRRREERLRKPDDLPPDA